MGTDFLSSLDSFGGGMGLGGLMGLPHHPVGFGMTDGFDSGGFDSGGGMGSPFLYPSAVDTLQAELVLERKKVEDLQYQNMRLQMRVKTLEDILLRL
jgi:hypothetical protein